MAPPPMTQDRSSKILSMMKLIRTSELSIKDSLSGLTPTLEANLMPISHRCYLREEASEGELTEKITNLSPGCRQGGGGRTWQCPRPPPTPATPLRPIRYHRARATRGAPGPPARRRAVRAARPASPVCASPLGPGLRVQGSEFRVQGSGFRVQGSGHCARPCAPRCPLRLVVERETS